MYPASIIVDLRNLRCGNCKVSLHDELATACPVCGAPFDAVSSNHVGLADMLKLRRDAAGIGSCGVKAHGEDYEMSDLVSS